MCTLVRLTVSHSLPLIDPHTSKSWSIVELQQNRFLLDGISLRLSPSPTFEARFVHKSYSFIVHVEHKNITSNQVKQRIRPASRFLGKLFSNPSPGDATSEDVRPSEWHFYCVTLT